MLDSTQVRNLLISIKDKLEKKEITGLQDDLNTLHTNIDGKIEDNLNLLKSIINVLQPTHYSFLLALLEVTSYKKSEAVHPVIRDNPSRFYKSLDIFLQDLYQIKKAKIDNKKNKIIDFFTLLTDLISVSQESLQELKIKFIDDYLLAEKLVSLDTIDDFLHAKIESPAYQTNIAEQLTNFSQVSALLTIFTESEIECLTKDEIDKISFFMKKSDQISDLLALAFKLRLLMDVDEKKIKKIQQQIKDLSSIETLTDFQVRISSPKAKLFKLCNELFKSNRRLQLIKLNFGISFSQCNTISSQENKDDVVALYCLAYLHSQQKNEASGILTLIKELYLTVIAGQTSSRNKSVDTDKIAKLLKIHSDNILLSVDGERQYRLGILYKELFIFAMQYQSNISDFRRESSTDYVVLDRYIGEEYRETYRLIRTGAKEKEKFKKFCNLLESAQQCFRCASLNMPVDVFPKAIEQEKKYICNLLTLKVSESHGSHDEDVPFLNKRSNFEKVVKDIFSQSATFDKVRTRTRKVTVSPMSFDVLEVKKILNKEIEIKSSLRRQIVSVVGQFKPQDIAAQSATPEEVNQGKLEEKEIKENVNVLDEQLSPKEIQEKRKEWRNSTHYISKSEHPDYVKLATTRSLKFFDESATQKEIAEVKKEDPKIENPLPAETLPAKTRWKVQPKEKRKSLIGQRVSLQEDDMKKDSGSPSRGLSKSSSEQ